VALHLGGAVVYKLHPVVVFSILDHYKRRGDGQTSVVGTLLGEKKGNNVYIKNCFPVPHQVLNDLSAQVEKGYHDKMLQLYRQVNESEVVVGWYSTGDKITYISSMMHQEMYINEVGEAIDQPVHLTVEVNTLLKNFRMGIKAYTVKTISVGDKDVITRFQSAPLIYATYEAEKIGVEALLNGDPESAKLDAPATILSNLESLEASLIKLREMLEAVSKYVASVTDGKVKSNPEIGRAIAEALAAVPRLEPERFKRMFNNTIQDLLMVVYLANLTRTQVALADKITGLAQ